MNIDKRFYWNAAECLIYDIQAVTARIAIPVNDQHASHQSAR